MFIKTIQNSFSAMSIASALIFPAQAYANHDDSHSIDIGGVHVCFGVVSCLFHPADPKPRDAKGTFDHRTGPIDRDPEIPAGAGAGDRSGTRTSIIVRDHRN